MAKDIEEFLKMAAQRRAEQKRKEAGAAGQPMPLAQPPQAYSPPVQPQPPVQRPPVVRAPQPVSQPAKPATRKQPQKKTAPKVTGNVRPTIKPERVAEHATRLGEEVGLADDKMDAHIQDVFAHDVVTIGESSPALEPSQRAKKPSLAADLKKMLGSPQSIRQAIILTEILNRPEFD